MGLVHVLLLNGQLILGLDLTQGYNTSVLTEEAQEFDDAFVTTLSPRVAGRLLNPMTEYQLEYLGGLQVYDFDPSDSEMFHQAEARGHWELGETTTMEAIEQAQYGSGNTLRQLDVVEVGVTEMAAARTRYVLNHGRVTLRTEVGRATQLDASVAYLLRRSLDNPRGDLPVFNYDTLAPEADVGVTRSFDEDNQLGLRAHYAHYLTPVEAGGNYFDDAGRITVDGMLNYTRRFFPRWLLSAEAGVVVGRSLEDDTDYTHVEPAASAIASYTTAYITARARYSHGFGAYGAETAGTASYDAASLGLTYVPDPLQTRLSFFATADGRIAREVVADLATQHRTIDAAAGVRYELNDYIRLFAGYEYRYQAIVNGLPELEGSFKRHVVSIGVAGEYAIPRRLNTGDAESGAIPE